MLNEQSRLAIVIPCYNEEPILSETLNQLSKLLIELIEKQKISHDSFIYCVDDGSRDKTWSIINDAHHRSSSIKGLRLSRNSGHQNALLAGLMHVKTKCDCAITLDADLQDDIQAITEMIDHFHQGSEIVYGVRQSRKSDNIFKRWTAISFYKLMQKAGVKIIYNHADFRLLSQRTIKTLCQFKERNLFLRGIFPLIGFKSSVVYYDRKPRLLGETKYPFFKMLKFAWEGITSFSNIPLECIFGFGIISFIMSLLLIVWVIIGHMHAKTVPGWASIMIPLCFMGGIQLLSVGILGEYIAKIYLEVKRRPRFIKDVELF